LNWFSVQLQANYLQQQPAFFLAVFLAAFLAGAFLATFFAAFLATVVPPLKVRGPTESENSGWSKLPSIGQ
jgi:hypothetical protein